MGGNKKKKGGGSAKKQRSSSVVGAQRASQHPSTPTTEAEGNPNPNPNHHVEVVDEDDAHARNDGEMAGLGQVEDGCPTRRLDDASDGCPTSGRAGEEKTPEERPGSRDDQLGDGRREAEEGGHDDETEGENQGEGGAVDREMARVDTLPIEEDTGEAARPSASASASADDANPLRRVDSSDAASQTEETNRPPATRVSDASDGSRAGGFEAEATAREIRRLEAEAAELRGELDGYRSAAGEMAAELASREEEVAHLREALAIEQGQARATLRAEERDAAARRLERAETALERERSQASRLQADAARHERAAAALRGRLEELDNEVVEARTAEAGARAELLRLRDQHVSLQRHLETLRGKVEGTLGHRESEGDRPAAASGQIAAAAAAAAANRARAARVAAAEAAGLTGQDLVVAAAGYGEGEGNDAEVASSIRGGGGDLAAAAAAISELVERGAAEARRMMEDADAHRRAAASLVEKMLEENELLVDKVNEQARKLERQAAETLELETRLREAPRDGGGTEGVGGGIVGGGGSTGTGTTGSRKVPGSPRRTITPPVPAKGQAAGPVVEHAMGTAIESTASREDIDTNGRVGADEGPASDGLMRTPTMDVFESLPPTSPIGAAALKGGGRRLSTSTEPAPVERADRPRGLWAFISGGDKAAPYGVPR